MTLRQAALTPASYAAVAAVATLLAFAVSGSTGGAGMMLGLAGAGFSICALWYLIRMLSREAPTSGRAKFGTFLVVVAFFAKLPFYMLLGMLAHGIGGFAPTCFLLGVGLVYFALVGWALAQS